MKTFRRPFAVDPPLDPEHFSKLLDDTTALTDREKRAVTTQWTVCDKDGLIISTHASEEAAREALAAAERNMP